MDQLSNFPWRVNSFLWTYLVHIKLYLVTTLTWWKLNTWPTVFKGQIGLLKSILFYDLYQRECSYFSQFLSNIGIILQLKCFISKPSYLNRDKGSEKVKSIIFWYLMKWSEIQCVRLLDNLEQSVSLQFSWILYNLFTIYSIIYYFCSRWSRCNSITVTDKTLYIFGLNRAAKMWIKKISLSEWQNSNMKNK